MKYKQLGKTGVLVSELCFGTMTFGGKGYWKAIGQQPEDEATQLVKTAFEHGINFFDTANAYSEGLAETLLGKAIKNIGISRQSLFIATRFASGWGMGQIRSDCQNFIYSILSMRVCSALVLLISICYIFIVWIL
jgi:aryl-alcohol dehydrogenase-like predicted oxidoreductase